MEPRDYYAAIETLERDVLSPTLVVYLDAVRANVAWMIETAGGADRWRPHVKTTKIPEVFAELARAGVSQFKCATTREAAHLCRVLDECDVSGDVLVAYPLIGPSLERLAAIARKHPRTQLSVLCEDPGAVPAIPEELSVFVDVNPGMNRTGVPLEERGAIFGVADAAGDRFRGVHYYDGHLHKADLDARQRDIHACYGQALELLAELRSHGHATGEIITSGTPTFLGALSYAGFGELDGTLHRISPGTVVYHDVRSEEETPSLGLAPAALVFSRVISHPAGDIATCDAGSKSVAAEAGDPCARVLGRPELEALLPSEEHLPLRVRSGERPERGTPLLLFPRHVCPTVNLAEEAVLVEDGAVKDVVAVAARAHELRFAP